MGKFVRQSNKIIYAILNDDETLYKDKHGDYKLYKDIHNLEINIKKHDREKVGIFELREIKQYK